METIHISNQTLSQIKWLPQTLSINQSSSVPNIFLVFRRSSYRPQPFLLIYFVFLLSTFLNSIGNASHSVCRCLPSVSSTPIRWLLKAMLFTAALFWSFSTNPLMPSSTITLLSVTAILPFSPSLWFPWKHHQNLYYIDTPDARLGRFHWTHQSHWALCE